MYDYVDAGWLLVSMERPGDSVGAVPVVGRKAWAQFRSDGMLVAFDTVNTLSGRYHATDSGVAVTPLGSTFAGHFVRDTVLASIRLAFGSLFVYPNEPGQTLVVNLELIDDQLILSNQDYRLVFNRVDVVP